MIDHIAKCTKPPKAGEYTLENRYCDEDFPPVKFFQEEAKVTTVRLGEVYQNAFFYNSNKSCFSIDNLSPHNAVNKAARSSDQTLSPFL